MAPRSPSLVALGYGKFARADRIYALVPIEGEERGDGSRTFVHVEGIEGPVVASRSERAILADVEAALGAVEARPRGRAGAAVAPGQESLL